MHQTLAEIVLQVGSSAESEEAAQRLARFGEVHWRRNLFWLDASGLALHFLRAIERAGAQQALPASVLNRLRQNSADNTRRTQALLAEFAAINRALESAAIPYAALKGFTLVPEYCADPMLRHQVDLDYLVAPEQIKAVEEAVRPLGYECTAALPHESRFAASAGNLLRHEAIYRAPVERTLEFHFRLFDRPNFPLVLPEHPLRRVRRATCCGVPAFVLDKRDQFLEQLLHAFQHVLVFNMRLSWLLEIATAVRNGARDTQFWQGLQERTGGADPRLGPILGLVLALTREMFPCDIPPELASWTVDACSPAVRLWVAKYGRRWALRAFPGNKLSLLVTREFMEQRQQRDFARTTIFPIHRPGTLTTAQGTSARWMQRRYVAQRAVFHLREALRLGCTWPGWTLRRLAARQQIAL